MILPSPEPGVLDELVVEDRELPDRFRRPPIRVNRPAPPWWLSVKNASPVRP